MHSDLKKIRNALSVVLSLAFLLGYYLCAKEQNYMDKNKLSADEKAVIWGGATERPFTGKYDKFFEDGIYTCKVCSAPLYSSSSKFDSGCGWPAFDKAFPQAIKALPDPDGERTEIRCARCGAHLGHVFRGEGFTPTNTRYCVNSISMNFIEAKNLERAIVAGGCFWGVEELMRGLKGVIACVSGYAGEGKPNPTYEDVCTGKSGYYEAVEVIFDKRQTSYSDVLKRFFEIHDFTQRDGQGPDIGKQYQSAVFYEDKEQQEQAREIIESLSAKGYEVATALLPAKNFYAAESYHQRYYERKKTEPYCHRYRKIF